MDQGDSVFYIWIHIYEHLELSVIVASRAIMCSLSLEYHSDTGIDMESIILWRVIFRWEFVIKIFALLILVEALQDTWIL